MNNWNKDNKTVLTLQMGDTKLTWETVAPCNDVPIEDIIQAFYSHLIGFTYSPDGVIDAFDNFVEEHRELEEPDNIDEL